MNRSIRVTARVRACLAWARAEVLYRAVVALSVIGLLVALPPGAWALSTPSMPAVSTSTQSSGGPSLESAASKAGSVGRNVAMSLIGLGFAVAAIRLVFRRSFKEAASVLVVGMLAILLATPAGVNVLHDTVNTLFGGS
jgi:hypothetical protein